MTQNRSHAVMAQRSEALDSLDDFPTPAWATRALIEHVIAPIKYAREILVDNAIAWEPACGRGTMSRPLSEYFVKVHASDIHDYSEGFPVGDFLNPGLGRGWEPETAPAWIITNPPFNLGLDFAERALGIAQIGVALLLRTVWIEGVKRAAFLDRHRLTYFAPFSERVAMVKGRLERKASTATSYSWFVWLKNCPDEKLRRIPPCRRDLDRDSDWP